MKERNDVRENEWENDLMREKLNDSEKERKDIFQNK